MLQYQLRVVARVEAEYHAVFRAVDDGDHAMFLHEFTEAVGLLHLRLSDAECAAMFSTAIAERLSVQRTTNTHKRGPNKGVSTSAVLPGAAQTGDAVTEDYLRPDEFVALAKRFRLKLNATSLARLQQSKIEAANTAATETAATALASTSEEVAAMSEDTSDGADGRMFVDYVAEASILEESWDEMKGEV